MQELLQSKAKMLNENLIVMRNGRMCLCVKAEYKNVLKGVIHDESASKTTVYIEPFSALEIANRIVSYKEEEKTEIAKILAQLSNVAFAYELEIKNNFNNLIALDIIFAKALYAISIDAYKPSINEMGIIDIKKARHPLIDRQKCVPIDIKLGEDYEAIIITGPNTGGKTVAIKTCGLLTLMMQAGLLIPASFDSKMAVFDNVFSDIGDEQSIEQSLSSFSAHMTKVIRILNELTNNSLVLLDELGSGTDPKEGSNLAISIVEYLLNKKSRVIVTTHYADLKAFAYDKDNIINASVEFDTKTLRPTYKLLLGVPGRSNAITIARGLGLNEEIINRSIELNETNHTDLSLMLSKLDDQNSILSEQIAKYEKENLALNERLAKLQAKELKLEAEYASFINKAKKEANDAQVSADLEIANSIAKAQKEKAVVQAEATRESKEAEINADTLIAQKENDLAIRKAELQKDADTKKAIADAAYQIQQETERKTVEIATADANLAKQEKAIILKEREVELTERTLEATIKKQAEAAGADPGTLRILKSYVEGAGVNLEFAQTMGGIRELSLPVTVFRFCGIPCLFFISVKTWRSP